MKKHYRLFTILISAILVLYALSSELSFYTTLENIKASHDKWVAYYIAYPIKTISIFILFNIFMAMLPVPGISMISFLGGTLFGFIPGMIYTSIATAIGNLGGFFIGRYCLQSFVYSYYGDKLRLFRQEWQKEGAMALFTFRLLPFIPSFVANLIMGVSSLHW